MDVTIVESISYQSQGLYIGGKFVVATSDQKFSVEQLLLYLPNEPIKLSFMFGEVNAVGFCNWPNRLADVKRVSV